MVLIRHRLLYRPYIRMLVSKRYQMAYLPRLWRCLSQIYFRHPTANVVFSTELWTIMKHNWLFFFINFLLKNMSPLVQLTQKLTKGYDPSHTHIFQTSRLRLWDNNVATVKPYLSHPWWAPVRVVCTVPRRWPRQCHSFSLAPSPSHWRRCSVIHVHIPW